MAGMGAWSLAVSMRMDISKQTGSCVGVRPATRAPPRCSVLCGLVDDARVVRVERDGGDPVHCTMFGVWLGVYCHLFFYE